MCYHGLAVCAFHQNRHKVGLGGMGADAYACLPTACMPTPLLSYGVVTQSVLSYGQCCHTVSVVIRCWVPEAIKSKDP